MLVLTRKTQERIVIGEGIEVVVLEVRGNRVRLGVECPDDVRIRRSELVERFPAATAKEFGGANSLCLR